jgi:predicted dehydrogenase
MEAVSDSRVQAVIVATPNCWLTPITLAAVQSGKHVLVEKPGALKPEELEPVIECAKQNRVCVSVGFNHRFHPAIQKAREIFESGALGDLLFIRGRYGHGGRIGYDKEWRADPRISGGGELIDQGVHLIDLAGWFLGSFEHVSGFVNTYFWDMPVDDNAFIALRTKDNRMAWLHASCTEWKNLFSFEIYGRDGKVHVEGLGGSYGTERITHYHMLPQMGPPDTTSWEYPGEDRSWQNEFASFVRNVERGSDLLLGIENARSVLSIVSRLYRGCA